MNWKFLLVLAFLVFFVSAQISQESAGSAASSLVLSGEGYSVLPSQYLLNNYAYWLVRIYPQSNSSVTNILVVVDGESGAIVNDTSSIQSLYILFYENNFLNSFNSRYSQFSPSSLNALSTGLLNNVSASQQALQQIEGLAPQYNFFNVSNSLQNVYNDVSILNSNSLNYLNSQFYFNQNSSITDSALNESFTSYGILLTEFYKVLVDVNSFESSIIPIANNLTASNFSRSDLLSTLYYLYPSAPTSQSFNFVMNYYNSLPSQSNTSAIQSVNNFESRLVEVQAQNEFNNLKTQISSISSSDISILQSSSFNFTKFVNDWNTVNALMNSRTESNYQQAITLMSQVSAEFQQAQAILSTPAKPSAQQTPVLSTSSLDEFIGIIVVLIIAYYAYLRYKKSKTDGEQET